MNTKTATNWYETILDSQKKMAESMNESAKKWSSNDQVNQTLEGGADFFKKWLDFQMDFVKNPTQTETMNEAGQKVTESFNNWKSFYENMFKTQNEQIQNTYNQNTSWLKQFSTPFNMNSNPFASAPWNMGMGMNNMPNMEMFGNWNKSFTDMYQSMMNNFKGNGNTKDVFEGLYGHTQSFMKFYELWQPVMEAMKTTGFNADMVKNVLKPEAYKEFMDSFFGFMPAGMKDMFNDGSTKWNEGMQNFSKQGMDMYKNFGGQMNQFMPQGVNMFTESLSNYNNMYTQMQNAVAPFAKLIAPNAFTKNTEIMASVIDMSSRYQILNSQMKYMTYLTGMKAMDEMGIKMAEKAQSGVDMSSINMQDLFKEWLTISDRHFVELFESETFSQVQAETSSLSHRIKGAMDSQMESMFANIPLVPRSEMDELYKTVYELKKRMRTMEKAAENTAEVEETPIAAAAPKAAAKKATK